MDSVSDVRSTVREIAAKYETRAKAATARLKKAEEQLEARRAIARARLRAEAQAREEREAAERQRCFAAAEAVPTAQFLRKGRDQCAPESRDDDETIPCMPPAKWRRAEADPTDDDSEATVDETPVLLPPSASVNVGTASATSSTQPAAVQVQPAHPPPSNDEAMRTLVADCSAAAAEAASRLRIASAERRRRGRSGNAQRGLVGLMAARWGKERSSSHDAVATERLDRSKSPRRVLRDATDPESQPMAS